MSTLKKNPLSLLVYNMWKEVKYSLDYPHYRGINGTGARFHVSNAEEEGRVDTVMNEERVIGRLIDEVREEGHFWDVGANIGLYSCFIANEIGEKNVTAFEPLPANYRRLKKNFSTNQIDVDTFRCVLSNESGLASLKALSTKAGEGEATIIGGGQTKSDINVKSYRGDDLIESGTPLPSVIKIDVEGAEALVIDGMSEILSDKKCRLVICEIHNDRFTESIHPINKLERHGFSISTLYERDKEKFIIAEK